MIAIFFFFGYYCGCFAVVAVVRVGDISKVIKYKIKTQSKTENHRKYCLFVKKKKEA